MLCTKQTFGKWKSSLALIIILLACSCSDFLDVEEPSSKVPQAMVFADNATATSAVIGIYIDLSLPTSFSGGGPSSLVSLAGLSSDELINNPRADFSFLQFEKNEINPANGYLLELWTSMYKTIYKCNGVIDGLETSVGVTATHRDQLRGEALFVRAFSYFYLVNLFGDAPLILHTGYKSNANQSRMPSLDIYKQIEIDLLKAEDFLAEAYPSERRARVNKAAATTLLSRLYLYMRDWQRAEDKATNVISKSNTYRLVENLNKVFLMDSQEAIWQIAVLDGGYSTNEGDTFGVLQGPKFNILRNRLIELFEESDNRRNAWVKEVGNGVFLPDKYKKYDGSPPLTEYAIALRLAELYLIRAEARLHQDKLSGAISDVNRIRKRAGELLISETNLGISKDSLFSVIENENRIEFLVEWGHRWLDLKRWNVAEQSLSALKPSWTNNDQLYPIPQNELVKNVNLNPQNSGY